MALDFPANPTDGQVYGSYIYSVSKGVWQSREESAAVAVTSPTPPVSANNGDIWIDTSDGIAYFYYSDGTSSQWVELMSSGVTSLASKANIDSPTFTGTLVLPSTTTIGNVDKMELGYLDGVTSGIQDQLNGKAASSHTHDATIITSGTFDVNRIPAGTVIQASNTKFTSLATTGSGSFVNFTSVNFTPKKSNSLILIQAMFSTSNVGALQVRNHNGTSIFTPPVSYHVYSQSGGPDYGNGTLRIPYFLQCTDSPGTTSTRTIEFYARKRVQRGEANLFLHPNNKPLRVNHLLTNFHLPKSTLLMLVASFVGLQKAMELYDIAIKERYRFYSYGDAMLIL